MKKIKIMNNLHSLRNESYSNKSNKFLKKLDSKVDRVPFPNR